MVSIQARQRKARARKRYGRKAYYLVGSKTLKEIAGSGTVQPCDFDDLEKAFWVG